MYSRKQASELRQEFWTTLGQYMSPVPSSEGEKINWINYRTGLKGVSLRMEANDNEASIRIEIKQESETSAGFHFERLKTYRHKLEIIESGWSWENVASNGQSGVESRIKTTLQGVHILNKKDWPLLISFFKQHLVILDRFWNSVKYSFEDHQ